MYKRQGSRSSAPSAFADRVNVPSPRVVAESTTRPSLTASTRIPAKPDSAGSIAFVRPPPPRVKSCQAVPVTFPGSAAAGRAVRVPSGRASGATPTSGSSTGTPARTGSRVVKPPAAAPESGASGESRPGRALGNAEAGAKVSCTPTQTALATPRPGSWS